VEGGNFVPNIKISRNQQVMCLHVKNATAWIANTKHRIVRKDTLLLDYMYFIHPTAIGHWYALAATAPRGMPALDHVRRMVY
jgi:hypothetical protein